MITCSVCDKECKPEGIAVGYATLQNGQKICYECAGIVDRWGMIEGKPTTLYLTVKVWHSSPNVPNYLGTLSNWPGTFKVHCRVKKGKHNLAVYRYDVWFNYGGHNWHGVQYGENSQLCRCRVTKS